MPATLTDYTQQAQEQTLKVVRDSQEGMVEAFSHVRGPREMSARPCRRPPRCRSQTRSPLREVSRRASVRSSSSCTRQFGGTS